MHFLHRLITPLITLCICLSAAIEGHYVIALSASILLAMIIARMMKQPAPEHHIPAVTPLPAIIFSGSDIIRFNNKSYPGWLQTENGDCFFYEGIDIECGVPNRLEKDHLVYQGVCYRLTDHQN